jgi:hypothetical protein
MEDELKRHLLETAAVFIAATGKREATVADQAAGDWRFFDRIRGERSFLASKYDSVMGWFAQNWPEGVEWPADIPTPGSGQEAAA